MTADVGQLHSSSKNSKYFCSSNLSFSILFCLHFLAYVSFLSLKGSMLHFCCFYCGMFDIFIFFLIYVELIFHTLQLPDTCDKNPLFLSVSLLAGVLFDLMERCFFKRHYLCNSKLIDVIHILFYLFLSYCPCFSLFNKKHVLHRHRERYFIISA